MVQSNITFCLAKVLQSDLKHGNEYYTLVLILREICIRFRVIAKEPFANGSTKGKILQIIYVLLM